MEHATHLTTQDFRTALAQMRSGLPVTAMLRVAEFANRSAADADNELDSDEASICREIEADARGLALAITPQAHIDQTNRATRRSDGGRA